MDRISANDLFKASAFSKDYNVKRAKGFFTTLICFILISLKFGNARLYVTDKGMLCLSWRFC